MSSNDSIHSFKNEHTDSGSGSRNLMAPESGISKVHTSGDGNEFVIIGNRKFYKHELMTAFGGTLNPGYAPLPVNKFANPAPLGLAAFSLTTFVLSMYNAKAMGIEVPNVVVSLACFYGGAVQFLAGVWEMSIGNTFGATALTSYGAFWLSYAAIFIESFGIAAAYEKDEAMMANAVGFYLLAWAIFTFMLVLCTLKSTVAFCSLFSTLCLTFILLAGGEFSGNHNVARAGGVVGVITAFIGFYNAFAGVANNQNSYVTANPIAMSRK